MTKFLRYVTGFGLAAVATLIAMEVVLRQLPVADGRFRSMPEGPVSSARLVSNRAITSSFGWDMQSVSRNRTNAQGFIAPTDYQEGSSVLGVFGDSYVEGATLNYPESLAGQLAAASSGTWPVYGFGLAGAGLPHHLGMLQEMSQKYILTAAVIVVSPGDFDEGFESAPGLYHWAEPSASSVAALAPEINRGKAAEFLRELALIRYFRGNLKLTLSGLFKRPDMVERACIQTYLPLVERMRVDRFVNELVAIGKPRPEALVLVFESERSALYSGRDLSGDPAAGSECPSVDELARRHLAKEAAEAGIKIVQTEPVFRRYYESTKLLLDSAPYDRHWNAEAVRLITYEVMKLLPNAAGRGIHAYSR